MTCLRTRWSRVRGAPRIRRRWCTFSRATSERAFSPCQVSHCLSFHIRSLTLHLFPFRRIYARGPVHGPSDSSSLCLPLHSLHAHSHALQPTAQQASRLRYARVPGRHAALSHHRTSPDSTLQSCRWQNGQSLSAHHPVWLLLCLLTLCRPESEQGTVNQCLNCR